jgi:ubiquinone/menaquinone biosynthesis C-methylase UbiE/cold shock CspA family protein
MNEEDAAQRSSRVAAIFNRVADDYDAVGVPWFQPIAESLVALLAPTTGERALDIGTGRGAALWPLVEAVGPSGHVTGIDLAERMIGATRADAQARGALTVDLAVGDAMNPDLPDASFDLIASSLVLFFLPDPALALTRWRHLLAPSGRLGISTFGPRDTVWEILDDVFTPYLPPQLLDARTSGVRGPFANDAGVAALLTAAGFVDVATAHADVAVRFTDIEHWRRWTMSHGQRTHWDAVPDDRRDEVLEAADAVLASARAADGSVTLTQGVRYTLGRRPA